MKLFKYMTVAALALTASSCTDLDETVYDQVMSENYYNTREDVLRAAYRPFDHAYVAIVPRFSLNEVTADQLHGCQRDSWFDQHLRHVMHYHTWSAEEGDEILNEWNLNFTGIMQCNYVIKDLKTLNPGDFGFTQAEFDNLVAQNRALRAWFFLKLLDAFRNVPMPTTADAGLAPQVEPKVLFEYIESELKDCIPGLLKKETLGSQSHYQTRWTQGAAAALLVRLYLNAYPYIGEERYEDCAKVAQDILDGVYGQYALSDRFDGPFDWDNDMCDEVMFGFTSKKGYSTCHYTARAYFASVPARARRYFDDYESAQWITESTSGNNTHYPKFAASPSYDLYGELYTTRLGMTVEKFRKYPGDVRMKLYRNIPDDKGVYNGNHEGFFLYGELPSINTKEGEGVVPEPGGTYTLCLRDAVGKFHNLKDGEWPTDKTSNYTNGDHNSGWHFVKYPLFPDSDPYQFEPDFTEIRLAEVIYSLAECKLRLGQGGAAELVNSVRRRNYPAENLQEVLYAPEGKATLDLDEMLDEWGREFIAEGRRRIDLVRYDLFAKGEWWDKKPDADNHTNIFPLMRATLSSNHYLVQNPGYGN